MPTVIFTLVMTALGMGVHAYYERKTRIAEHAAYERGYRQGVKEEQIRNDAAAYVARQVPTMVPPQIPSYMSSRLQDAVYEPNVEVDGFVDRMLRTRRSGG